MISTMEAFPDQERAERAGVIAATREKLGVLGGVGHYHGDDREIDAGGPRNEMDASALRKILNVMWDGQGKINLKVSL